MKAESRHSAILICGTGLTSLLTIAYTVYAGRVLGPDRSADFFSAVFITFIFATALGPVNATVSRFAAEYSTRKKRGKVLALWFAIARRVILYGGIGFVLSLVLIQPLAQLLRFQSPWPLVLTFAIGYLSLVVNVDRGVLRGLHEFGMFSVNTVLEAVFRLGAGLVLLALAPSASFGLLAYVVGLCAILPLSRRQMRKGLGGEETEPFDGSEIRWFLLPMFLLALGRAGFMNMDILFVKHYFEPQDVGCYGAASAIARTMGILCTPFNVLLLPFLTALHTKGENVTRALFRFGFFFIALAAIPLAVFYVWPEWVVTTLFKKDFAAGAPLLFPLAVVQLLVYLASMVAAAFASVKRFEFLYVYLVCLGLEAAALIHWSGSMEHMITAMLSITSTVLFFMVVLFLHTARQEAKKGNGQL